MAKTETAPAPGQVKLCSSRRGPPLRDPSGSRLRAGPESLVALESIELGGVTQWLSLRGRDRKAPILLCLHGGPGSPETPLVRKHAAGLLEESFLVVAWEQRGAGKSYHAGDGQALSLDLMLSDLLALVDWLRARFAKEKIFILGHSWGSLLGILFAQAHPEKVAAFASVGQFVAGPDNEKESYRWTLEQARARKVQKAIKELSGLAWYGEDPLGGDWKRAIKVERRWLYKMGGGIGHDRLSMLRFAWTIISGPEYTFSDRLSYLKGSERSLAQLWPEVMGIDLRKSLPRLEVPAFFFLGRWDWTTPSSLASDYLRALEAPKKDEVWFEASAHSPCYEEPGKFGAELVRLFLGRS